MRFEWDAERTASTSRGTTASLSKARRLSDNPHAIFRKDRVVSGEQRWHAIGAASGAVLLVVHVYRMENEYDKEETIRIVSAREANKRERQIYIRQAGE
jgi:uncharacterized DUF497 family protein